MRSGFFIWLRYSSNMVKENLLMLKKALNGEVLVCKDSIISEFINFEADERSEENLSLFSGIMLVIDKIKKAVPVKAIPESEIACYFDNNLNLVQKMGDSWVELPPSDNPIRRDTESMLKLANRELLKELLRVREECRILSLKNRFIESSQQ